MTNSQTLLGALKLARGYMFSVSGLPEMEAACEEARVKVDAAITAYESRSQSG